MEIKARLLKPFTERQRMHFIVEQNHRNGFEIEDRENELVALGQTEDELTQLKNQRDISKLKDRLLEIDMASVRPLRAILSGEATDADRNKLVDLENEAQSIRDKIIESQSIINDGGVNE